jgi:hypothetical protein
LTDGGGATTPEAIERVADQARGWIRRRLIIACLLVETTGSLGNGGVIHAIRKLHQANTWNVH